ncbi:hypothetical protein [Nonomuraea sp. NPDC049158]|uniref:effector-associated constant component EACC1 n=1 Tax=Nonomuraea sp. NPDC049158 TaxID=3155649 RepID=UPI0033D5C19E
MDDELILSVDAPADQLRDLRGRLAAETPLRGRVRLVHGPPPEGALGVEPEALSVVFGAGGALATVTSVVIAWLSSRKSEVTVKITRGSTAVEVSAKGVKSLDMSGTQALTTHLTKLLDDADAQRPTVTGMGQGSETSPEPAADEPELR